MRTRVGYAGGRQPHPTYRRIGDHTETVEVDYDPAQITLRDLLAVFWASHHPGSQAWSRQYLNVIFYRNAEQQRLAQETGAQVAARLPGQVKTAILPATEFTLAEDYHQKYYLRRAPALFRQYALIYPELADLVNSTAAARVNGYLAGFGSMSQLRGELPGLGLSAEAGQALLNLLAKASPAGESCPVAP